MSEQSCSTSPPPKLEVNTKSSGNTSGSLPVGITNTALSPTSRVAALVKNFQSAAAQSSVSSSNQQSYYATISAGERRPKVGIDLFKLQSAKYNTQNNAAILTDLNYPTPSANSSRRSPVTIAPVSTAITPDDNNNDNNSNNAEEGGRNRSSTMLPPTCTSIAKVKTAAALPLVSPQRLSAFNRSSTIRVESMKPIVTTATASHVSITDFNPALSTQMQQSLNYYNIINRVGSDRALLPNTFQAPSRSFSPIHAPTISPTSITQTNISSNSSSIPLLSSPSSTHFPPHSPSTTASTVSNNSVITATSKPQFKLYSPHGDEIIQFSVEAAANSLTWLTDSASIRGSLRLDEITGIYKGKSRAAGVFSQEVHDSSCATITSSSGTLNFSGLPHQRDIFLTILSLAIRRPLDSNFNQANSVISNLMNLNNSIASSSLQSPPIPPISASNVVSNSTVSAVIRPVPLSVDCSPLSSAPGSQRSSISHNHANNNVTIGGNHEGGAFVSSAESSFKPFETKRANSKSNTPSSKNSSATHTNNTSNNKSNTHSGANSHRNSVTQGTVDTAAETTIPSFKSLATSLASAGITSLSLSSNGQITLRRADSAPHVPSFMPPTPSKPPTHISPSLSSKPPPDNAGLDIPSSLPVLVAAPEEILLPAARTGAKSKNADKKLGESVQEAPQASNPALVAEDFDIPAELLAQLGDNWNSSEPVNSILQIQPNFPRQKRGYSQGSGEAGSLQQTSKDRSHSDADTSVSALSVASFPVRELSPAFEPRRVPSVDIGSPLSTPSLAAQSGRSGSTASNSKFNKGRNSNSASSQTMTLMAPGRHKRFSLKQLNTVFLNSNNNNANNNNNNNNQSAGEQPHTPRMKSTDEWDSDEEHSVSSRRSRSPSVSRSGRYSPTPNFRPLTPHLPVDSGDESSDRSNSATPRSTNSKMDWSLVSPLIMAAARETKNNRPTPTQSYIAKPSTEERRGLSLDELESDESDEDFDNFYNNHAAAGSPVQPFLVNYAASAVRAKPEVLSHNSLGMHWLYRMLRGYKQLENKPSNKIGRPEPLLWLKHREAAPKSPEYDHRVKFYGSNLSIQQPTELIVETDDSWMNSVDRMFDQRYSNGPPATTATLQARPRINSTTFTQNTPQLHPAKNTPIVPPPTIQENSLVAAPIPINLSVNNNSNSSHSERSLNISNKSNKSSTNNSPIGSRPITPPVPDLNNRTPSPKSTGSQGRDDVTGLTLGRSSPIPRLIHRRESIFDHLVHGNTARRSTVGSQNSTLSRKDSKSPISVQPPSPNPSTSAPKAKSLGATLSLVEVLAKEPYRKALRAYMVREFCQESLDFIESVEKYEKKEEFYNSLSPKTLYWYQLLIDEATGIHNRFIRQGSEQQINIDSETRVTLEENIKRLEQNRSAVSSLPEGLFRPAAYVAYKLLDKDTYVRFRTSEDYLAMVQQTAAKQIRLTGKKGKTKMEGWVNDEKYNFLQIQVSKAKNLKNSGSSTAANPFCVVYCDLIENKTKTLKKTNNPEWGEGLKTTMEFPLLSTTQYVEIHCYDDQSSYISSTKIFLGRAIIPLAQIVEPFRPFWISLIPAKKLRKHMRKAQRGEKTEEVFGELRVRVALAHKSMHDKQTNNNNEITNAAFMGPTNGLRTTITMVNSPVSAANSVESAGSTSSFSALAGSASPGPPQQISTPRARGKTQRFVDAGYDLDLSYIAERILVLAAPIDGPAITSNSHNSNEIVKFFERRHPNCYKLLVLAGDKEHFANSTRLGDKVERFCVEESAPGTFEGLDKFCKAVDSWLSEHPQHVVATLCSDGVSRSGMYLAAYYLYTNHCANGAAALKLFSEKRCSRGAQVILSPSQQRYLGYYEEFRSLIKQNLSLPAQEPLFLSQLSLIYCPKALAGYSRGFGSVWFKVESKDKSFVSKKITEPNRIKRDSPLCYVLEWNLQDQIYIHDDFKLSLYKSAVFSDELIGFMHLNTRFAKSLDNSTPEAKKITVSKLEIDKIHKDNENKLFPAEFRLEIGMDMRSVVDRDTYNTLTFQLQSLHSNSSASLNSKQRKLLGTFFGRHAERATVSSGSGSRDTQLSRSSFSTGAEVLGGSLGSPGSVGTTDTSQLASGGVTPLFSGQTASSSVRSPAVSPSHGPNQAERNINSRSVSMNSAISTGKKSLSVLEKKKNSLTVNMVANSKRRSSKGLLVSAGINYSQPPTPNEGTSSEESHSPGPEAEKKQQQVTHRASFRGSSGNKALARGSLMASKNDLYDVSRTGTSANTILGSINGYSNSNTPNLATPEPEQQLSLSNHSQLIEIIETEDNFYKDLGFNAANPPARKHRRSISADETVREQRSSLFGRSPLITAQTIHDNENETVPSDV
jgi:hypothetical protein